MRRSLLIPFVVSAIMMSFCGREMKGSDMSNIKDLFYENERTFNCVAEEAKRVLSEKWPCLQKDTVDGYIICVPGSETFEPVTEESGQYGRLVSMLSEGSAEMIHSIELEGESVCLSLGDGKYVLYSKKIEASDEFPLEGYYSNLEWERTIENGQIIFVSDHRNDHETNERGMYYKYTMEKVGNDVYVSHLFIKHPWYSFLIR